MTDSDADIPTSALSSLPRDIAPPKPVGLLGWVLFAWLVIAYSDAAATLLDGSHLESGAWSGMILGTGISVAYFRTRRGQRGWPGFFIGSAIGSAGCFVMAVACGLLRGLLHRF